MSNLSNYDVYNNVYAAKMEGDSIILYKENAYDHLSDGFFLSAVAAFFLFFIVTFASLGVLTLLHVPDLFKFMHNQFLLVPFLASMIAGLFVSFWLVEHCSFKYSHFSKGHYYVAYYQTDKIAECPTDVISHEDWNNMLANMIRDKETNKSDLRVLSRKDCYKVSSILAQSEKYKTVETPKVNSTKKEFKEDNFDKFVKKTLYKNADIK